MLRDHKRGRILHTWYVSDGGGGGGRGWKGKDDFLTHVFPSDRMGGRPRLRQRRPTGTVASVPARRDRRQLSATIERLSGHLLRSVSGKLSHCVILGRESSSSIDRSQVATAFVGLSVVTAVLTIFFLVFLLFMKSTTVFHLCGWMQILSGN